MADGNGLLVNAFIFLLLALLAVPGAKRLGMGPAVGYLLSGVFIGPWGLAIIRDSQTINLTVEVSTVVLLFIVALQATPARIRMLAKDFLSLSMLHFGLTALLILGVSLLTGLPWHHALVCGMALSLSSSALANQAFYERYPTGSPLTDTGRRLLLSQNLAMVPILVFLPLLGFDAIATQGSQWPRVVSGLLMVAFFAVFGRFILRYLFRYFVSVGLDEVFAAFALILVIATLLLAQILDLPLELGAMLAGLLLTRSEYGSAINIAIRPFRELLIGVFFISIGMTIDFGSFIARPLQTLVLVVLLVAIKTWVLRNILRYSSVPRRQRIWLATVLSQSGELAFIVIAFAVHHFAVPERLGSQLTVIVALSMLTTPLLLLMANKRETVPVEQQPDTGVETGSNADTQVVIAGYGRVGRVVAHLLQNNGYRLAIIDHNPDHFGKLRHAGFMGFYGDARRADLLEAAGIKRAAVIVIAIDNTERSEELIRSVRREYPHITIISRALDTAQRQVLLDCGADRAYPETFETALLMGEDVLELVGVSPLDAQSMAEAFRDQQG